MRCTKNILLIVTLLMLAGCLQDNSDNVVSEIEVSTLLKISTTLQKTQSCGEFKQYLTQSLIEQYLDNQGTHWGWCPNCRVFTDTGGLEGMPESGPVAVPATDTTSGTTGDSASPVSDDAAKTAEPGSVTGTNNQEAGVDELDRLKTDSKGNMFLVQDNELIIINAFPASEMSITSRLHLDFMPSGLFIDEANQKAVVISQHATVIQSTTDTKLVADGVQSSYYTPYTPEVTLYFIDISDLSNPILNDSLHINGSFNAARMIDTRLHLVINHWLSNIEESFRNNKFSEDLNRYWKAKELGFDSLENDIKKLYDNLSQNISDGVESLDLTKIFPYIRLNEETNSALLSCTNVFHPDLSLKSSHLLSVMSIDTDGTSMSSSAIFSSGGVVYSSEKSIYISQPSSNWWWNDKKQQTAIHKFSLTNSDPTSTSATGNTKYVASGLVAGIPQKSFNFSEYKGYLRVATTEASWPENARGQVTDNNLFILQDDGAGNLETVGSVENFAKNESIMSARFLGDKGFVVTFERIDPLFTFDLSKPETPKLMGELEIPGFSTYMHPIGENHLLTIGRSGTETGIIQETQLQLFDISDLTNPVRVDAHIPEILKQGKGYGYSIAEADHHAFTYSSENNVLAIPLSFYNWQTGESFAGISTFNINISNGISENGNVDHSDFYNTDACDNLIIDGVSSPNRDCIGYNYQWNIQPNRSFMTSDNEGNYQLYSLSRSGVKANDLGAMETTLGAIALMPTASTQ